jgi:hypothetical protein
MKSNFALSLSFDGIRLLHRAAGGWRLVGEVSLETADMGADLASLRESALVLEPKGLRTKLLLPDEQIKYLSIETPDLSRDDRLNAARAALIGATPYPVDDLAFDICEDGAQTHIAAVAKETLAEAEGFATEYAFNPVSFTATPGDQPYLGAPFFGEASTASAALDGAPLEHDDIAVVVIGDAIFPEEPFVEPVEETPQVASVEDTPIVESVKEEDPAPSTVVTAEEALEPDVAQPDLTPSEQPVKEGQDDAVQAVAVTEDAEDNNDQSKDIAAQNTTPTAPPPVEETVVDIPKAADEPKTVVAPIAASLTPKISKEQLTLNKAEASPSVEKPKQAGIPTPVPPIAAEPPKIPVAPPAGFASRRAAKPEVPANRPEPALTATSSNNTQQNAAPPVVANYADVVLTPPVADVEQAPVPEKKPARAGFLSRRRVKAAAAPAKPVAPKKASRKAAAAGATEAERMTIFGARSDVGGKPKFLGLMLTAALLVFLAGVAAWASVFLDDGINLSRFFGERAKPEFSTAEDPPRAVAAPEEEAILTASLDPELTPEDTAVLDALRTPVIVPDATLNQAELEAKYAATGIWSRAPVGPPEPASTVGLDDLYLTGIDPVSTAADAIALPNLNSFATDVAMVTLSSPTAAGTQFALDARGLVIPTAQGALSPEGIIVYLGKPPLTPPTSPTRFQTEPVDTRVRSALAELRPQLRPGSLTENYERAQLDGLTRSELATLRPALRPRSIQDRVASLAAAASTANPEAIETDAAVTAALVAPQAPAIENATKYAVRASVRPDTRPRNFARIVRRAERAAPKKEVRVASAATVAPRVVKPSIPSSASVARQATVKNAINLRKVNLIGVYGKPSSRRALIRMSNGRYRKVTVGDRIDGGRVSAIGQSELRYSKGGRNVVLKMPKG